MEDDTRQVIRTLTDSIKETNKWLYELNGVVVRVDERLARSIEHAEKRADGHSEAISGMDDRIAKIERSALKVQAWSAGAACVVTGILGLFTWVVSRVPADAWTKILGGG